MQGEAAVEVHVLPQRRYGREINRTEAGLLFRLCEHLLNRQRVHVYEAHLQQMQREQHQCLTCKTQLAYIFGQVITCV